MYAIFFPNIDPVILDFGALAIRWYGLSYVCGILIGAFLLEKLEKKYSICKLDKKCIDSLVIYIILGIIIGGRFGDILFYYPEYIIDDFFEIFKVWHGGMSFHGGIIGVAVAIYIFSIRYKKSFLRITDLTSCVVPIGLFFGRIANFINAELYGKKTDVPWGVYFPNTDYYPRHPSQLYEAFLEGIVLFIIMMYFIKKEEVRNVSGKLSGYFLIFYAIFRIFIECFREPDSHIGYIFSVFTMGQLLSFIMIIIGVYICGDIKRNRIYKFLFCRNIK
ncbi:MAG: phosphatidylglycerol:prolipoprotein diacylglycerol transferase [Candidatus Midichloriaceae bacterium]|jgi:phosphatidylglycerol:prolipoprotein diacylglycerol transferase